MKNLLINTLVILLYLVTGGWLIWTDEYRQLIGLLYFGVGIISIIGHLIIGLSAEVTYVDWSETKATEEVHRDTRRAV